MMFTNWRHQPVELKYPNENLFEQYPKAFAEAENGGAEVIVIKAAKPGVFSAGLDITEFYQPEEEKLRSYSGGFQMLRARIFISLKIPV